ncbi:hypothetical protein MMC24_001769 [Lignoscripta atroalba]|nr:hypothetical protein [Lignoscripta atroalba]
MAFMQTPTSATFDFNQLQNQQYQQRMQNGDVRHGSPAFHNSLYQTQSIVPSKRPRPSQDGLGASPRQIPGVIPASRSQTPQQTPYSGFNGNVNGGQHIQAPTPYQHLQHVASSNASPSPIMQDQHFNPQAMPQRMQTVSPLPFSPGHNFGSQASPPQSDYGSRVDTPQSGGHSYVQGMTYAGGPTQHFTPPPGTASNGASYGHLPPNIQQQQRLYEMRHQQMVRQLHATNNAAQHRHQNSAPSHPANPPPQMASYPQTARTQQMQQSMIRPGNPEQFVRTLAQFMQARGLPLNTIPIVGGRPVNLMQLYAVVMKSGGSKKVTATNQWSTVAASLAFPPVQFPSAAQEIQNYWHSNLGPYESVWWQNVQHQQRQRAANNQVQMPQQLPGGTTANMQHDQFSPVKQLNSQIQDQSTQLMHARRQSQTEYQTPVKQMSSKPQQNGYSTPQQAQGHNQPHNVYGATQTALSLPPQVTPPHIQQPAFSMQAPPNVKKEPYSGSTHSAVSHADPANCMPRKAPMSPQFLPKFQSLGKGKDGVESHGGVQVSSFKEIVDQLIIYKPNVPFIHELGEIDIRAIIMSLRSGIHAEVRLALDTLASLSIEQRSPPSLGDCEDLVETLIDCAEEQVELLAENAAEVSDVMLISPYEEVVRGCRCEVETLQDIPDFGSLDYDLDRSVERLICITTILRNLSFFEANHPFLADPIVVRFMATVIRYLGTRNMLLRTYRNTLDFTKDIVIYLSNLSHSIDLPGKEEASCMLHFLLSFAPSPPPAIPGSVEVMFSSYNPSVHRYLPPAVDSLAKLLARDDPNRTFYKSIFSADSTSTPPYDLLTRTFALSIAPIPEHAKANLAIIEARKPYLAQGLLAAEILVTLIPGPEHTLARSWLNSQDGFSLNLLRLVSLLSKERAPAAQRHPSTPRMVDPDPQAYGMITHRGIAVLRRLAEKAKDTDAFVGGLPAGILPKETLLEALVTPHIDCNVVRQLCAYAELES